MREAEKAEAPKASSAICGVNAWEPSSVFLACIAVASHRLIRLVDLFTFNAGLFDVPSSNPSKRGSNSFTPPARLRAGPS
jgi:hypothetical protein